jgi:hypothetical protein
MQNNEEFGFSSSCFLNYNLASPRDMMMKSLAPCRHALLLQCYRSFQHDDNELASSSSCFFCSSAPQSHDNKELSSLLSCFFVLMLQVIQVRDDEEFSSLSSCFFLFHCHKSQRHNEKEFGSFSFCFFFVPMLQVPKVTTIEVKLLIVMFFCSNVTSPKDTMNSLSSCFFYSNVTSPKDLTLCCHAYFFQVLQVLRATTTRNLSTTRSSTTMKNLASHCYVFFNSNITSPLGTWRWEARLLVVMFYFVPMLQVAQAHINEEVGSSLSCFF